MREKYKTLSLAVLRELAKARGMKGISALKKDQLIERMIQQDELEQSSQPSDTAKEAQEVPSGMVAEKSGYMASAEAAEPQQEDTAKNDGPETKSFDPETRRFKTNNYYSNSQQNQYGSANTQQNQNNPENRRRTTAFNGNRGERNSQTVFSGSNRSYQTRGNQERSYQDRGNQERSYQDRGNQERSYQDRGNQERSYQDRGNQERSYQDRGNQERSYQDRGNQERSYQDRGNQERSYQDRGYQQSAARLNQNQPARQAQQTYDPEAEERMREADAQLNAVKGELSDIDSGNIASGILDVLQEGYGFIRSANYMPGDNDVYVSPSQIRRFNLKTGDIVCGNTRIKTEKEKFSALLYVTSVNGYHPSEAQSRPAFETLTPIFPEERLVMERPGGSVATRVVDLLSPIGKGQRGMIVSPPKAGKTTLLKEIAKSITYNNPEMKLIILLIDERPEEVTDIKEAIEGDQVEVIYSTFDETPEHHKKVSEMVIERAKRLVEHRQDVTILLDSITRLARAYNLTVPPSGRTLSGGLDPAALHMPKRFFGAARNMRGGGSLTILATALVDTGSKMDDVVFEEFKGTGNMELVLDRKLSEKRIFPAIDMAKSGTRREDLLLSEDELMAVENMRRSLNGLKPDDAVETILNIFAHTKTNAEVVASVRNSRII